MSRYVLNILGVGKPPATPQCPDSRSDKIRPDDDTPCDNSRRHIRKPQPSSPLQHPSDQMDVDDELDVLPPSRPSASQDKQSLRRQHGLPSMRVYRTNTAIGNQREHHDKIDNPYYKQEYCEIDIQTSSDEVEDAKTRVKLHERKTIRESTGKPDSRFRVNPLKQVKVPAQWKEVQEKPEIERTRNEDLTSQVSEASRQIKELQDKVKKMEFEREQGELRYQARIRENQENAREEIEQRDTRILQLEVFSSQQYEMLNEKFEDLCEQSESQLRKKKAEQEQLRIENQELSRENHSLQENWVRIYEDHIVPWARGKNMRDVALDLESIDTAIASMAQDSLNIKTLRENAQSAKQQIQALQQQLLSNVEKIEPISDEQFAQQFESLAASIKSFSRTAIPLSKANEILAIGDIINASLTSGVDPAYWTTSIRKKCLIEAFIWSILVDFLFANAFSLLGDQYMSLSKVFVKIFGAGEEQSLPPPSHVSERWRRVTMQHLLDSVDKQLIANGKVNCKDSVLVTSIEEHRTHIFHEIERPLYRLYPAIDSSKINPILEKAFNLAMHMSLQQFRLQVIAPDTGDNYTAGINPEMTSVPESENVPVGRVGFIVRPGLAKWGDAHGKNLDQRLDLVSSLVFIEPYVKEEA